MKTDNYGFNKEVTSLIVRDIWNELEEMGYKKSEWAFNPYGEAEGHAYKVNGIIYSNYSYITLTHRKDSDLIFDMWIDLVWTNGMKEPAYFIDLMYTTNEKYKDVAKYPLFFNPYDYLKKKIQKKHFSQIEESDKSFSKNGGMLFWLLQLKEKEFYMNMKNMLKEFKLDSNEWDYDINLTDKRNILNTKKYKGFNILDVTKNNKLINKKYPDKIIYFTLDWKVDKEEISPNVLNIYEKSI